MSTTPAAAGYFERVAGQWGNLRSGYFGNSAREAAIARAYLRPEMVVANVGAGAGFMTAGLAPLVKQVYVLDGSAALLEAARRHLAAFANAVYRRADGAALPLEDASLDAVFANLHLLHCPDPQAAIAEMARVLKPGGRLVVLAPAPHPGAGASGEGPGFERSDLRAWLRAAGLVNVIVDGAGQCGAAADAPAAGKAEAPAPAAERPGAQGEDRAGARADVFVATGSRRVSGARAAVQARYGAAAEAAGTGGCGCETGAAAACCSASANVAMSDVVNDGATEVVLYDTGYRPEQLADVPVEAAALSLGCGNPTALAGLKPGETVLDIGSGGGIDVFYAAKRVGPAGRAIGLDMTPAMIERARASAAAAGIENVEFRLGQAEAMPVEDDTVDVILSNCVINLAEDKGRVFEEAYRVLRAGGRLSISDMVTGGPLPAGLRGDPQLWAGCINGALPETEYLDLVRQAGFAGVTAQRTLSAGEIAGVPVYSLAVSGVKRPAPRVAAGPEPDAATSPRGSK